MELIIELKVYKLSIGAACGLEWPPDRIIIQVLDDSTDPIIKVGYLIYIPRSICFHFQIKIFFFHLHFINSSHAVCLILDGTSDLCLFTVRFTLSFYRRKLGLRFSF